MFFVHCCKREYLSKLKVVFFLFMKSLLCQKPNGSSIISNASWALVTAVTACLLEQTIWTISFYITLINSDHFAVICINLFFLGIWGFSILNIYLYYCAPRRYPIFKLFQQKNAEIKTKYGLHVSQHIVLTCKPLNMFFFPHVNHFRNVRLHLGVKCKLYQQFLWLNQAKEASSQFNLQLLVLMLSIFNVLLYFLC